MLIYAFQVNGVLEPGCQRSLVWYSRILLLNEAFFWGMICSRGSIMIIESSGSTSIVRRHTPSHAATTLAAKRES